MELVALLLLFGLLKPKEEVEIVPEPVPEEPIDEEERRFQRPDWLEQERERQRERYRRFRDFEFPGWP